jgi:hypothetical protein
MYVRGSTQPSPRYYFLQRARVPLVLWSLHGRCVLPIHRAGPAWPHPEVNSDGLAILDITQFLVHAAGNVTGLNLLPACGARFEARRGGAAARRRGEVARGHGDAATPTKMGDQKVRSGPLTRSVRLRPGWM